MYHDPRIVLPCENRRRRLLTQNLRLLTECSLWRLTRGFQDQARTGILFSPFSDCANVSTPPTPSLIRWRQNPAPVYESDADCEAFEEWAYEKMTRKPTQVRPCVSCAKTCAWVFLAHEDRSPAHFGIAASFLTMLHDKHVLTCDT